MYLKEHLEINKISVLKLSKDTGIAYSTLNDLINRKTDAESCKAGMLKKIAERLNITLDEVYAMCHYVTEIELEGVTARLYAKNQTFCITINDDGELHDVALFRIYNWNHRALEAVAERELEKYIKRKEREAICSMS